MIINEYVEKRNARARLFGFCENTGKRQYASQRIALRFIKKQRTRFPDAFAKAKPYQCRHCSKWHVTQAVSSNRETRIKKTKQVCLNLIQTGRVAPFAVSDDGELYFYEVQRGTGWSRFGHVKDSNEILLLGVYDQSFREQMNSQLLPAKAGSLPVSRSERA